MERATALAKEQDKQADATVTAYLDVIDADPDYRAAHEGLKDFKYALIQEATSEPTLKPLVKRITDVIDDRYKTLEARFPNSPGVAWGVVLEFYWGLQGEDPRARPYLLKVVARDPTNAEAYERLSDDAERRGDRRAAMEYIHKASLLEPQNVDYAYYYVSYLHNRAASLQFVKRFPRSDRSAQTLFWLAYEAPNDAKRIAYLEQLRAQFSPEKFSWSASGMSDLFDAYLRVDPAKALSLAEYMQSARGEARKEATEWSRNVKLAQAYIEVNRKVAGGKSGQAVSLLDYLTPNRFSSDAAMLVRLKAQVLGKAGQMHEAYNTLLKQQAQAPDDETLVALRNTGSKLHKTVRQVDADLKTAVLARAKVAPPLDLQEYASGATVSLEKLRGRVVLITFWFPGCGPCRLEMPHLEAVLRQLHNKDIVYLGINGVRDQDAYVQPFMEKTHYSFTPLKGTEAVTGPNGFHVRGYPSNFLINRSGDIVYSGFDITDAHGELVLRRMIESLLYNQQRPAPKRGRESQ